jgi:hypothetical protein
VYNQLLQKSGVAQRHESIFLVDYQATFILTFNILFLDSSLLLEKPSLRMSKRQILQYCIQSLLPARRTTGPQLRCEKTVVAKMDVIISPSATGYLCTLEQKICILKPPKLPVVASRRPWKRVAARRRKFHRPSKNAQRRTRVMRRRRVKVVPLNFIVLFYLNSLCLASQLKA